VNHRNSNFIVRTLVWFGFLSWWIYLRKPEGSSLLRLRPGVTPVAGVLLAVAGVVLYVWAAHTLARSVPSALAAPADLLRRGPYRYVRNPLYLAVAAVFVGAATLYAPWRARDLVGAAVVAMLTQAFVVRREEPATRERLGSTYDEYCADVPRWIPRLSSRAITRANASQR
jgi:protein-S-isoprenylcysteine O-methyltransferase Ste14